MSKPCVVIISVSPVHSPLSASSPWTRAGPPEALPSGTLLWFHSEHRATAPTAQTLGPQGSARRAAPLPARCVTQARDARASGSSSGKRGN